MVWGPPLKQATQIKAHVWSRQARISPGGFWLLLELLGSAGRKGRRLACLSSASAQPDCACSLGSSEVLLLSQ